MSGKTSLRKAAVLLASLPQDEAASLMAKLTPKQVEAVSIEIAQLDSLSADEQEKAINDFVEENPHALGGAVGGLDLAKKLVEMALGKEARQTLESLEQSVRAMPFSFLRRIDPQNLLSFISDEHPQTIAVVLSHLPPAYGAEVIASLSPERQLSVIQRIAKMGQTNPEVIKEVEQGLETRLASLVGQSVSSQAGGVDSVAQILNITERATERALMENLAEDDAELAEAIRRRMFVFEDLLKISDKDIQSVLKNVESSQWAMALKGQSERLREKVLGNMSQRAADMLREEMEYLGPVRASEVEQMQQQIVDMIRSLEDAGQITIAAGEQEEYIT